MIGCRKRVSQAWPWPLDDGTRTRTRLSPQPSPTCAESKLWFRYINRLAKKSARHFRAMRTRRSGPAGDGARIAPRVEASSGLRPRRAPSPSRPVPVAPHPASRKNHRYPPSTAQVGMGLARREARVARLPGSGENRGRVASHARDAGPRRIHPLLRARSVSKTRIRVSRSRAGLTANNSPGCERTVAHPAERGSAPDA
jgi:hypothetical protein